MLEIRIWRADDLKYKLVSCWREYSDVYWLESSSYSLVIGYSSFSTLKRLSSGVSSLPRTYSPYGPFPLLLQRVVPSHNHTQIPCFISLTPLFPFSCSTYTPTDTFTVFTSQAHSHTTAPLSSLSPSTPTSHFLHQPHWDPNTRDK